VRLLGLWLLLAFVAAVNFYIMRRITDRMDPGRG
jgi:hypothetical protein